MFPAPSRILTQEVQADGSLLIKAGLTLGADILEVFTFVGVLTLSFGRLRRGKAIFLVSDTWLIIQRCGAEALVIVSLINFLIGVIL